MKNNERKLGLSIIIILLALSNFAGIFKILYGAKELSKIYTLFNSEQIKWMVLLPIATIVSLIFIWLGKKSGIIITAVIFIFVITLDLYYLVWPHAILATVGFALLMFFCWQSKTHFTT